MKVSNVSICHDEGVCSVSFDVQNNLFSQPVRYYGCGGSLFGALLVAANTLFEVPRVLACGPVTVTSTSDRSEVVLKYCGDESTDGHFMLAVGEGVDIVSAFLHAHARSCVLW